MTPPQITSPRNPEDYADPIDVASCLLATASGTDPLIGTPNLAKAALKLQRSVAGPFRCCGFNMISCTGALELGWSAGQAPEPHNRTEKRGVA